MQRDSLSCSSLYTFMEVNPRSGPLRPSLIQLIVCWKWFKSDQSTVNPGATPKLCDSVHNVQRVGGRGGLIGAQGPYSCSIRPWTSDNREINNYVKQIIQDHMEEKINK